MRLILGPGTTTPKLEGDIFCDIIALDGVDVVHDLNVTPWPFKDNSFDHISAVHLVEHLENLIPFMDECHRVLKPGGTLYIETPLAGADDDLEFADPTHVRCYRPHTWINYMTIEGVDKFHYTEKCWGSLHFQNTHNTIALHLMPIK